MLWKNPQTFWAKTKNVRLLGIAWKTQIIPWKIDFIHHLEVCGCSWSANFPVSGENESLDWFRALGFENGPVMSNGYYLAWLDDSWEKGDHWWRRNDSESDLIRKTIIIPAKINRKVKKWKHFSGFFQAFSWQSGGSLYGILIIFSRSVQPFFLEVWNKLRYVEKFKFIEAMVFKLSLIQHWKSWISSREQQHRRRREHINGICLGIMSISLFVQPK